MLLQCKRRDLKAGPQLAVADGAPGFWQAIEKLGQKTRGQRCWVQKTANELNKQLTRQQSKAKLGLRDIWLAETRKGTIPAFDATVEIHGVNFDEAFACPMKDHVAFNDFPPGIVSICR